MIPGVNRRHEDVIKWKHFPRYWPFLRGIHRSPVNSSHKGQWRGALMFSLIWAWKDGWVNIMAIMAIMTSLLWQWVILNNGSLETAILYTGLCVVHTWGTIHSIPNLTKYFLNISLSIYIFVYSPLTLSSYPREQISNNRVSFRTTNNSLHQLGSLQISCAQTRYRIF